MAEDQALEAARDAQPAARVGDEIAHGFGLAGMIAGAVVGALVGAAVLAATAATGGLAIAIMGGAMAGGGLSVLQVVKGLSTLLDWPEPTTGKLAQGSPDVFINGKPAARLGSKLACGAHIKTGSENVFIGGSTVSVVFVLDLEGWMKTGLEVLGLAAVATAAVLAAMVGATALAGVVVVGSAVMGGMALLGDLGDRLGPGYRDLLQGVAGIVLLGAGPKAANVAKPHVKEAVLYKSHQIRRLREEPLVLAEGRIGQAVIRDVNQRARPAAQADRDHPTLIAEKVNKRVAKHQKPFPNGNMADAHAEVGVIQRAYEAGLTKNADMVMTVKGKYVCDYCKSDVASMAKAAGLRSLSIHEMKSGRTLFWESGMNKMRGSGGE